MALPLWRLTTARRKLFEAVGSRKYSHPAYGKIQQKLEGHLRSPGFFVEAGAVDGFFESNTYCLERFLGWRGILIEPVPSIYRRIKTNRPKTTAFNCALVAKGYPGDTIRITAAHAISRIVDDAVAETIEVSARTLSSILEEAQAPHVDLLSLDVEGFEIEVMKGLDFARHKPAHILIECLTPQSRHETHEFLTEEGYDLVEKFSDRDFFYRAR